MRLIDADAMYRTFEEVYREPDDSLKDAAWWFFGKLGEAPTITQPPNDPLTLEELIAILEGLPEITGEPVFVLHKSGARQWHLLKSIGSYAGHRFVLWEDRKMDVLDDYGINWWAYRRKPVEGTDGVD